MGAPPSPMLHLILKTWVRLRPEGVLKLYRSAWLNDEISQIVVRVGGDPDAVIGLLDVDGLSGKDLTEIDFPLLVADAPAGGAGDGRVVEVLVLLRQAVIKGREAGSVELVQRGPPISGSAKKAWTDF
jgi:hypothetical protein